MLQKKTKEHTSDWLQIPDHPYRILIISGPGSVKTNSLFILTNHQPDFEKVYSYAKDPFEVKYKFSDNKQESSVLKYFNYFKAFTEYSNDMDDIYKNVEEFNPNQKRKILFVFDVMIVDMLSYKKFNLVVPELCIRGYQNYFSYFYYAILFSCAKTFWTNFSYYFIMKIPNK